VETGAHDATLAGHGGEVAGHAVHGDRLYSVTTDGTIRVWALGTRVKLKRVRQFLGGASPRQYHHCLAVSGIQLVRGSVNQSQGGCGRGTRPGVARLSAHAAAAHQLISLGSLRQSLSLSLLQTAWYGGSCGGEERKTKCSSRC
jgi:hypothetical protein